MERNYKTPPIVWLKVTDYMHGWLQRELGCDAMVGDQRVVCLQHLPGMKEAMRMETSRDMMDRKPVVNAMSATRRNCIAVGLDLDAQVMQEEYGLDKESLGLFVPVECPRMCMTDTGVLRPWTLDVCFGREQATTIQKLIRQAFWDAVTEYDRAYAKKMEGEKYPAVEMIEAFCADTGTCEIHIPAMRREWQRRVKREKERA